MVKKIPPPPMFTTPEFQAFNRWLLEVTSILSNEGGIAASEVDGLLAAYADIAANTLDIAALTTTQGDQATEIANIQGDITNLQSAIGVINGQITSLSSRAQVLNGVGVPAGALGNINDWYGNVGGGVGARIYIKTAVATWTPFPF